MRKVLATVAVACGIGLITLPFALSLFDRAPAGERVTNRFRQTMSAEGLHSLRTNFATMGGLVEQFIGQASPQLAGQLHMTPSEYNAFVAQRFPAVRAAVRGLPPLIAFATPVAAQLEALQPQFAAVDSLPFLGLPLTSVPWILLGLGVAVIGSGLLALRFKGRWGLAPAAALGAAMVVAPLALSYPSKASDATKVAAVGHVALSPRAVVGAQTANRLIDGMVSEVDSQMIPVVARRLHVSPQAFTASLGRQYPAIVGGLAAWPRIKPGAQQLVRLQVASLHDAATMNGLRFAPLPWYIMGPGIALLLLSAAATAAERRQRVTAERPIFGATRLSAP